MYKKIKVICAICKTHIKNKKHLYKEYKGRYCCVKCKDKIFRSWAWGEDDL